MKTTKITEHFTQEEFNCKDGSIVPIKFIGNLHLLCQNLEIIRESLKCPIHVNSGYRSPEYNKKVGGVSNSQHLQAKAVDISTKNYTPSQVHKIIYNLIMTHRIMAGGLGLYYGFVHYDIRGHYIGWDNR